MRVLVCGGRKFNDREAVYRLLDYLHNLDEPVTQIIHGGAQGADQLAEAWAMSRQVQHRAFLPNWNRHGLGAGPRRNERMLMDGQPAICIAFPGGPGTKDMTGRCRRVKVPVLRTQEDIDEWHAAKEADVRATAAESRIKERGYP